MTTTLLNSRYQIIQVLGAGGFGETFLAEDTYLPSRRRCVIKQLKPVTNDPQMYQQIQQRFQREAATLETLGEGSDQIPNLYAYFTEKGQFYLVQEWIQGETLSSKVEVEGPLSETAVWKILVSLLQVLHYVHSKGIIYRDIKPDNIIVRQSNGKPVLIDFGAVKETVTTIVNSQGQPTYSIIIGTPGFMSPEQASGRPLYASDIYSLGVTAIYLLTGKLPQALETDSQTEQILWQQSSLKVSPHLAAVINKATQYHPRDRYTTAIKMLDDLQAVGSLPPRQKTTQATMILPPGWEKASSKPTPVMSPSTTPAINRLFRQANWQQNFILGSLLAAGLLSTAVVVGFVRNQTPESSRVTSLPPQSNSEQPIAKSPLTTESPKSDLETDNAPSPAVPASPSPSPDSASQTQIEEQTTESPAPPVASAPQTETKTENEEQTTESPAPPVDSTPQVEVKNKNQDESGENADVNRILGFPTGTSEDTVKAALGKPTRTSRGVWQNTRAVMYDLKPSQITLGYLFDRNSGRLRQTEVSFAQSVTPEVMQATLQRMLGGGASAKIDQALQQVYQRQTNRYSFNTGGLEGVIERNNRDRIYIGVWDADLH